MRSSMEGHFRLLVGLSLFFFLVDLALEALFVLGQTPVKIGGSRAETAYVTCAGIALGIFRGMLPAGEKPTSMPKSEG